MLSGVIGRGFPWAAAYCTRQSAQHVLASQDIRMSPRQSPRRLARASTRFFAFVFFVRRRYELFRHELKSPRDGFALPLMHAIFGRHATSKQVRYLCLFRLIACLLASADSLTVRCISLRDPAARWLRAAGGHRQRSAATRTHVHVPPTCELCVEQLLARNHKDQRPAWVPLRLTARPSQRAGLDGVGA